MMGWNFRACGECGSRAPTCHHRKARPRSCWGRPLAHAVLVVVGAPMGVDLVNHILSGPASAG